MKLHTILLAALAGFWLDFVLTFMFVTAGFALLGIQLPEQLQFSHPGHILVGLILPVMATMIGGAVAGFIAYREPQPAGAFVGGLGLLNMAIQGIDSHDPHALTYIIAQCVATITAVVTATIAARYRPRVEQ